MIYLDSNIFIYAALNIAPEAENCLRIMDKIVRGDVEVGTSVLTWDEIFQSIKKKLGSDYARISGQRFLNLVNLNFFDADLEVLSVAQKLTEKYNLGPRDAIHAATAVVNGCKEIITDDSDFDKIKELKRIKIK